MESYFYKLAASVLIVAAQISCQRLTEKNAHIRKHFEFFGALFAIEALNGLYGALVGIHPTFPVYHRYTGRSYRTGSDWTVFIRAALDVLRPFAVFLNSFLPFAYLLFVLHTILSSNERSRLIAVRFVAAVLAIGPIVYFANELSIAVSGPIQFSSLSENFTLASEYTELINLLLLVGSFCCVDLKKTQSVHRLLLLAAVAVRLPSRIFGIRDSFAWHVLPLFFPVVYYFATRKHEKDQEKEGEKEKEDLVTV